MKAICCGLVVFGFLVDSPRSIFAQGSLTPPAAPTPTMKTLDQIEPRTVLSATNTPGDSDSIFRITQPGSYYLAGNVNATAANFAGIEVAADDVTIDLRGFRIQGAAGSGPGIRVIAGFETITITNGVIRSCGGGGIAASGSNHVRVTKISATHNGTKGIYAASNAHISDCIAAFNSGSGIETGGLAIIDSCSAMSNTSSGINASAYASISNCTALSNGVSGISTGDFSAVINCTASNNTQIGIRVQNELLFSSTGQGSSVTNCTTSSNGSFGIFGSSGSTISGCTSIENEDAGFVLDHGATIIHCTARSNGLEGIKCVEQAFVLENNCSKNGTDAAGAAGIKVLSGQGSRIEGNTVAQNDRGIEVVSDRNFIVRNSCRDNLGHNYVIAAGNRFGQVIVPAVNPSSVDGDAPSGGFTSTDPWANYSF